MGQRIHLYSKQVMSDRTYTTVWAQVPAGLPDGRGNSGLGMPYTEEELRSRFLALHEDDETGVLVRDVAKYERWLKTLSGGAADV